MCSLSPAFVKSRGVTRDVWFFSGSFAVFCFSPNLPRYVVRDSMHQGPAYVLLIPTLPTAELPTDNLCAPSPPMAHSHGKVNSAGNSHRVAQHRLLFAPHIHLVTHPAHIGLRRIPSSPFTALYTRDKHALRQLPSTQHDCFCFWCLFHGPPPISTKPGIPDNLCQSIILRQSCFALRSVNATGHPSLLTSTPHVDARYSLAFDLRPTCD